MQPHILHTNCAPPLEPLNDNNNSASLAKLKRTISNHDPIAIPSRSNSLSSNSNSTIETITHSGTNSQSSSVSLSAQTSFASLSLTSMQNINIGSSANNNDINMNIINKENNNNTEYNNYNSFQSINPPLRRSKRISTKRKRHDNFENYTPEKWALPNGQPMKKRRKTTETIQKKSKIKIKKQSKNKPLTASQLLNAQNSKMRQIHNKIKKQRIEWIKYNYSSFEPFLSDKIRKRLRPKDGQIFNIISTKPYTEQPSSLIGGTLRDYQLYSLNWLRNLRNNGIPAILADEMGLGKTIQSIACIASFLQDISSNNLHSNNCKSPSLIICPLSVAEAWLCEFAKWLPSLRSILFHGPKLQRENLMKYSLVYGKFDICITTYEIATNNKGFLNKFMWNYFILDEAHKVKNENTNWHTALKLLNLRSLYCILLTGTPIQNNMHELWSLLSFMFSDEIFDIESSYIFDSAYEQSKNKQNKQLLSKTPYLLTPFFLRRLKSEVELSLPPKEEIIIKLKMSSEQRKYYKSYLYAHSSLIDELSDVLYAGDREKGQNQASTWKKLRHLYTELRKIALHPFLLSDLEHKIHIENIHEMISHSSKLQLLDKLLFRLKCEGHRVLIFSCFTLVLNLLQIYCQNKGYKYLRLDGSTSRIRRKIDILRFNDNPKSPFFIYLISNRAGGLGINLQSADTVIHFDTDWNPQADLQAQARAHRIGQKNMVKIYRLITKDTVEERILYRSQQKLYLDAIVNKGAKMLQDNMDIDDEDSDKKKIDFDLEDESLLQGIKFGAQKMFDNDNSNDNDDIFDKDIDLDLLLERDTYKIKTGANGEGQNLENEQRNKLLTDLTLTNNVKDFNFGAKLLAGNVFEGEIYEKKELNNYNNNNSNNFSGDVNTTKRNRNNNSTIVKDIIVDGLRFKTRIEINKNNKFYKQCSEYIYDNKTTQPFHHQLITCWGCDQPYTENELNNIDNKIIKCHQCPKTFHNKCWIGEKTKMGVFICSQHKCRKCTMKTSECGMILRCIGCQLSFCYQCTPQPYWKNQNNNEGMYFQDECKIDEYYKYYLPKTTYMYIFCSKQCKKYYNQVYMQRQLPDLSLKYEKLSSDNIQQKRIKRIIKKSCKDNFTIKSKMLKDIEIDYRIRNHQMPNNILKRFKQNINGNCQLMEKFYDILYLFGYIDNDDENKQEKDYILGEHYVQISQLNTYANQNLTLPQWICCNTCKKWRVTPIKLYKLRGNTNWMSDTYYTNWKCNKQDGFDYLCKTIQEIPNKQTYNKYEINILRLQRNAMSIDYKIKIETDLTNKNLYKTNLLTIQNKINKIINEYKLNNIRTIKIINNEYISCARYIGISQWNGFIKENYIQNNKNKICKFYEYLIQSFRYWRIESIKTLMDHLGFFVVSKKKQKGTNQFHVDKIALSYNKEKVLNALATFLTYPTNKYLELNTAYFSNK